jgi:serine phosphatase RsbU (regulator of sigma subunit)
LTSRDIEQLFTRDAPEAYRFFSRQINIDELKKLPWHRRTLMHARLFFLAFTLKLSPPRRAIYAIALAATVIGLLELFQGVQLLLVPHPVFANGTVWLLIGFLLINLLVMLEVADRLSLKNDLEIAREIQQAMLPRAAFQTAGLEAFGMTRPANTVGGDFYDILPLPDGQVLLALGDVAGKGSPAALLMALLLAMMRTLVDEGLGGAALVTRLNAQIVKHAPRSRFITLFVATLDPVTGRLTYVNAGQNPPLLRRSTGDYERLRAGGMALGMFDHAEYTEGHLVLGPGDVIVMYSDGVTEAEDVYGRPFDEAGLEQVVNGRDWASAKELGWATFVAVEHHSRDRKLLDDLTVLVLRRLPPIPVAVTVATAAGA